MATCFEVMSNLLNSQNQFSVLRRIGLSVEYTQRDTLQASSSTAEAGVTLSVNKGYFSTFQLWRKKCQGHWMLSKLDLTYLIYHRFDFRRQILNLLRTHNLTPKRWRHVVFLPPYNILCTREWLLPTRGYT